MFTILRKRKSPSVLPFLSVSGKKGRRKCYSQSAIIQFTKTNNTTDKEHISYLLSFEMLLMR